MSRYDVLTKRSGAKTDASAEPKLTSNARRGNPAYRQFSAYIPADLYRKVKVQLAELDLDLSVAVEQALATWLAAQHGSK